MDNPHNKINVVRKKKCFSRKASPCLFNNVKQLTDNNFFFGTANFKNFQTVFCIFLVAFLRKYHSRFQNREICEKYLTLLVIFSVFFFLFFNFPTNIDNFNSTTAAFIFLKWRLPAFKFKIPSKG